MILGIDVSTSITGFAIIGKKGQLIDSYSCDLRKYKNVFDKAEQVAKVLEDYSSMFAENIESVYIEQSLFMFMSGRSSAKTIALLSKFNGIVSWLCYDILDIKPEFLAATTARKHCGIKVPRGKKAKEVVLQYLLDNEPNFKIEYTRNGNPKPESYDRADAIVIARAAQKIENENLQLDQTQNKT